MKRSIKFILGLLALSLAMAFIAPLQVWADDADKNEVLPEVGIIAIRSIDALQSFIKQTGADLPPGMDAAGLEAQFPFIGKGGLDTTRPIGIVACGAPGLELAQIGGFAIPVKPTGGLLESIKAMGAVPMPGHPDTVVLNGVGLRRTVDYLIFSPTPQIAVSVDTNSLLNAVKGPDVLFRYEWNFKNIRVAMPAEYKKIPEYLKASTQEPKSQGERKGQEMATAAMLNWMESLDRADVSLENNLTGVKLVFSATPVVMVDPEPANLPGMPADTFARIDVDAVSLKFMAEARSALEMSLEDDASDGVTLTAEQKKKSAEITHKIISLMLDPSATSVAGGASGDEPVLYIVQHWVAPMDVPAQFEQLTKDLALIPSKKNDSHDEVSHYADGDLKVLRVTEKSDKAATFYIDVAQRNNDVYVTVSKSDKHLVASLATAAPLGPMKNVMSGSVDLGKTIDFVAKLPDSPLASMPQETRTRLAELLKDQTVTISTRGVGQTGSFDIAISKELLRKTPKLMEIFSAAPAPAGEPK